MNLLKAMMNISKCDNYDLRTQPDDRFDNQATIQGKPLELFIKDSFCGIPGKVSPSARKSEYEKVFSYTGSKNHPPDAVLRGSDAIEIKKMAKANSRIHFNSSPPKSKIHSTSRMITEGCRRCEDGWTIKDIIYAVGISPSENLKMLFFVYGDCYAAENSRYEKPFEMLKSKISEVAGVNTKGNEFGLLKNVDHLMRADLRIRPLWMVDSPWKVFASAMPSDNKNKFTLSAIMLKKKYESFPKTERSEIEKSEFAVNEIRIKDPNDPARTLDAKSLRYTR